MQSATTEHPTPRSVASDYSNGSIFVMFDWLKNMLWGGRDDERRHETSVNAKARMLEMDEPMAGAGALLAAEPDNSETEMALNRAAEKRAS